MPKTKFQSLIFTLMMVFCMVFVMTVYTVAIGSGGLAYWQFAASIREMWVEYAVVFVLIFFIVTPNAMKLAFRHVTPGKDKPIFCILAIQCFTVCQIVPMITLFATFFHHGFTSSWFVQWVTLICQCFPMALCTQLFLAGPLVRFVFRHLFAQHPAHSSEAAYNQAN